MRANLIILFLLTNSLALFSAPAWGQEKPWMDGTWIGISYQISLEDTWKVVLDCDVKQDQYLIDYPSLFCRGEWDLQVMTEQKARFKEVINKGFNVCQSGRTIVITRINENYITYSCFAAKTNQLEAYATLVRVDDEQLEAKAPTPIRMENTSCNNLYFDLDKGTLNGLVAFSSQKEIKEALPCYTGDSPDGAEYNCGGGVFYLNHDFYFYSGQNYIEVRDDFPGQLSQDILSKSALEVEDVLGPPLRRESVRKWDGTPRVHYFYPRTYGCLSLVFVDRKVHKIAIHSTAVNETELCY